MDLLPGIGAGSVLQNRLLADGRAIRIGAVQRIDFHEAVVLTHDRWKFDAGGIPQHSFLLATAHDAANPGDDDEVLLLRVEGTASLSLEADLHAVREEALRAALSQERDPSPSVVLDYDMDPFTKNRASFTGLRCRVLGTFYEATEDGTRQLVFGSDVDNFYATSTYRVLKPIGAGLSEVASYLRPDDEASDLVTIGNVRYSATMRRADVANQSSAAVTVRIQDFIGHKTALLGMTRTGKSNTAKIIVARTFIASQHRMADHKSPIGQLIFDPQGEYANDNIQDGSAIAALGAEHVRIFRFGADGSKPHVRPLAINFFDTSQIGTVQGLISDTLGAEGASGYVTDFASTNFSDTPNDVAGNNHAGRGRLALFAALIKAGFSAPRDFSARVSMKQALAAKIAERVGLPMRPAGSGYVTVPASRIVSVVEAIEALRSAEDGDAVDFGKDIRWQSTAPMVTGQSTSSGRVRGFRNLIPLREFHNSAVSSDIAADIYQELLEGRVVIVDLHIGSERVSKTLSETITVHLLKEQTAVFTSGKEPPLIQVMLEEAHNLFSTKRYENDADVWIRLAKEAAKLKIGMIYATQEVTGVAHQVKANTANWVVSHLNNRQELNELGKFYDFGSFQDAILASEDRGYVRLKTLSSPFVVPVQIERYGSALIAEARVAAERNRS